MKIKNKIAITLLPLILVILVVNLVFGLFFRRTINNQEQRQVTSARINIASYIIEQSNYYNGIVYHWGHSDDTYNFINDRNSDYIDINQSESTYHNLNVSFNILLDSEDAYIYKQYYSVDNERFADFPKGFFDDFSSISGYSKLSGDVFGIYELADSYYFISTTFVTDAGELKPSNGKIFVGRHIDQSIISKIEDISGCKLISIETLGFPEDSQASRDPVVLYDTYLNGNGDSRLIELIYSDPYGIQSAVKLTLSMPRNQFISEAKEMNVFSILNTIVSIIISLFLFLILSRYLSKPISKLVADIKSIDVTQNEFHQLQEDGNNEFAFLRKSINMLLVRIFKDISEKNEITKRIEFLSYHDQLTGLYNRRFYENELRRLDSEGNLPLSIIYADVNGLKIINDAFGHESGDRIIQKAAEILRTVDNPNNVVARVGGDEFIILLPKIGAQEAEHIVERLREQTNQLYYLDIELSVSFGWDTKYEDKQSTLDVLRNAEDIMYQKKMLSSTSKRNVIIKSILNTLNLKCPREEKHSKRVSSLCASIGHACDLNTDDIKELAVAGELHDIGKIAIDEVILNKTEALTNAEWSKIKHHPDIGFRILGATSEFYKIAEYVLEHHEKWDGTGYPKGLKGTEINWKARVISIADAYDAMTCDRPYRKALSPTAAAAEIRKNAGTQFDPDLARIFIEKLLELEW